MSGIEAEPDAVVDHVGRAITTDHPEHDPGTVEGLAREELATLQDDPVQDHVEVLTEHAVQHRSHGSP